MVLQLLTVVVKNRPLKKMLQKLKSTLPKNPMQRKAAMNDVCVEVIALIKAYHGYYTIRRHKSIDEAIKEDMKNHEKEGWGKSEEEKEA